MEATHSRSECARTPGSRFAGKGVCRSATRRLRDDDGAACHEGPSTPSSKRISQNRPKWNPNRWVFLLARDQALEIFGSFFPSSPEGRTGANDANPGSGGKCRVVESLTPRKVLLLVPLLGGCRRS